MRYLFTIYCDDIRYETGNKVSLMGMYQGGELHVQSLPATLAKLCAVVRVVTGKNEPFKRLTIKAKLGDRVLGELAYPPEMLEDAERQAQAMESENGSVSLVAHMAFAPVHLSEEGVLRVTAETEAGDLQAGQLKIRLTEEP